MDMSNLHFILTHSPIIRDVAKDLEQKSNVHMEDENVNEFRSLVMKGDFRSVKAPMQKL
jgi:hypothetical protein